MNDLKLNRLFNIYGHTGGNYAGNVYDQNGLCPTILIMSGGNRQPMIVVNKETRKRIRRLTPVECFRLMGFTAEDCRKCQAQKVSDTQLYKQAGNSIGVPLIERIFMSLGQTYDEFKSA